MKKRSRKQIYKDYAEAIAAMKANKPVKRSGAKDGSIPTHPIIPVSDLPESEVLKDCLRWLRKRGVLCNRNNTGSGQMGVSGFYSYGIKGAGDIIGLCKNGVHFEIECKRGRGGRLSEVQQKRMKGIKRNNGLYFIIHGVEELGYLNNNFNYFGG